MSLLAKHSIIKEDKSNIITLGIIAREEKKKDPSVINATIGMLYDELGNLFTFDSVDKALLSLSPDEKYAYSSTAGSPAYHEALKSWVFRDTLEDFSKEMHIGVMATPGGSGAISNTFTNYLNEGEDVLLPSYMWGNYKQFAYENHLGVKTYDLFNSNNTFNLESLEQNIKTLIEKQNRVLFVINDPCHNPTGYTMSSQEWVEVINIINKYATKETPVIMLYDMAYIDFDARGFDATRANIDLFKKLNENAMVVMAFSGSKTLALYGIRIGGMIGVSKVESNIEDFKKANQFSSRAKWSNTTNLGINLVSKIFLDKSLRNKFEEELESSRQTLIKRANTFLEESKKVNLETLPFVCGFFITIPCNKPEEVYKELVKRKIHVVPMNNVIRVTISAITIKECKMLPSIIKECIDLVK